MIWKCSFIYFPLLLHKVAALNVDKNTIDMVTSFVGFQEKPTSLLIPNLCWTSYETLILAKTLSAVGVFLAKSLQHKRSEYYVHHILVLADLDCVGADNLLLQASKQGYFKSPYRWLLLNSNYTKADLEALEMPVDSDVVIASRTGQKWLLMEVYKISENTDVIYTARSKWRPNIPSQTHHMGYSTEDFVTEIFSKSNPQEEARKTRPPFLTQWDKNGVIEDYRRTKVISVRRSDLRGHVLTMANVVTDSNDTKKHMKDRLQLHQDSIAKLSYNVVRICFQMLNAREKLIFTSTWGYKDKNGSWNGVIDHLLKQEADLGTITIFTQERMEVIDYIAMVGSTKVRFVFREPPLAYVSNIFMLPFQGPVWTACLVCVLGCAAILYIISKWEATMGMHPYQLDGSWEDILILTMGAVLQQGCPLEPRHAAGRCVTLLLFVALTILFAAYSANIVVLLRASSASVRTLTDLLQAPLKFGASDFEYNRYFFKKLNDPIRKSIYDKKIAPRGKKPNYFTMKDGVEKIRKGLFAFHMETNPGYRLIQETYQEHEKCDLVEIDYINEIDPWLPGQKRAPFKDLFKINFIKIRETGVQANIHRRLTVPRPRCSGTVSTFSSVGITDMLPMMLATLYGMLMAPFVLLLEILHHRLITVRQRNTLQYVP